MDMLQNVNINMQDALPLPISKPHPTEEIWGLMRPIITRLYQDEKKPLKQVKQIMESDYFFYASERMFKTRIKNWGLDKKFKEAEVVAMLRLKRERDAVGKKSCFVIRNQTIDWDRVVHYLKRRPDLRKQLSASNPRYSELCQDIVCRTPSPVNPPDVPCLLEPTPELRFHEEILRILRSYLDGALEGGMWVTEDRELLGHKRRPSRRRISKFYNDMGTVKALLSQKKFQAAFYLLNQQLESLKVIIADQDPELLYILCYRIWYIKITRTEGLSEPLISFIRQMHQIVLGDRHPLSLVWSKLESTPKKAHLKIVATIFIYSAQYFQSRGDHDSLTSRWINAHQLVLLDILRETNGSEYEKVLSGLTQQAAIALQNDDLFEASWRLLDVAGARGRAGDAAAAMGTLEKVQSLLLKGDQRLDGRDLVQSRYCYCMGRCLSRMGMDEESVRYSVKAYEYQAVQSGFRNELARSKVVRTMIRAYSSAGDSEKANQWLEVLVADMPEFSEKMNLVVGPES